MYKRANLDEDNVVLINKEHVAAETQMTHRLEPPEDERANFPGNIILFLLRKTKVCCWCLVCVSLFRNVLAGKFAL